MEEFTQLFNKLLAFAYECFDRIVIHGYLSGLSRPEQVVYFVRQILGMPVVSKEGLRQRTREYNQWVQAYARNHHLPLEWAQKRVRKEDHDLPSLARLVRKSAYGVYFIFQSMEQGPSFRVSRPKYPSADPNYRIVAPQRSRFRHYYFYIRDEVLGPVVLRIGSFLPFQTTYWLNGHSFIEQELKRAHIAFHKNDNAFLAVDNVEALQAAADRLSPKIIRERLEYWTFLLAPKFSKKQRQQMNLSRFYAVAQIEYSRNFIFKRHFPIHKIFERSCEIGLWRALPPIASARSLAPACTSGSGGSCRPSSIRSSTAITFFGFIGRMLFSNSMRSSPASCATSFVPTISATLVSRKDSTIWKRYAKDSAPSPTALPASRRRA